MFSSNFHDKIQQRPLFFIVYTLAIIVFFSAVTFTFVIPGLYGFSWLFFGATLVMYFIAAHIFAVLLKARLFLVFLLSLVFSAIGMGLRFFVEWGEFSLIDYSNLAVAIGYPVVLALLITAVCMLSGNYVKGNKRR